MSVVVYQPNILLKNNKLLIDEEMMIGYVYRILVNKTVRPMLRDILQHLERIGILSYLKTRDIFGEYLIPYLNDIVEGYRQPTLPALANGWGDGPVLDVKILSGVKLLLVTPSAITTLSVPFDTSHAKAVVFHHPQIMSIGKRSGFIDPWLLLAEIYNQIICYNKKTVTDIINWLFRTRSRYILENMEEYFNPGFKTTLKQFIKSVLVEYPHNSIDSISYSGHEVYEARAISRDHVALTFVKR